MAAINPEAPTPPVPSGADKLEYYDIMFVGNTGQGKSTTADKILIANPTGHNYRTAKPVAGAPVQQKDLIVNEQQHQLQYADITIWLGEGIKDSEFETHLRFLDYSRTKDKPHEEVNKGRSAMSNVFKSTADCEVLSNETSKIRVMDVPVFFDGAGILSDKAKKVKDRTFMEQLDDSNLDIMRKIVRIQTALSMKFKRILYFLPVRGPLDLVFCYLCGQFSVYVSETRLA